MFEISFQCLKYLFNVRIIFSMFKIYFLMLEISSQCQKYLFRCSKYLFLCSKYFFYIHLVCRELRGADSGSGPSRRRRTRDRESAERARSNRDRHPRNFLVIWLVKCCKFWQIKCGIHPVWIKFLQKIIMINYILM